MNFKHALKSSEIKRCIKTIFSLNLNAVRLNSYNTLVKDESSTLHDFQTDKTHKIDIDLVSNPQAKLEQMPTQTKDHSFKYDEIIVCKIFDEKGRSFSTRMFILKKYGLFNMNYITIFHQHILEKSFINQTISKQDTNVIFDILSNKFEFKRPTLYEYVNLKAQIAVSSHFSILTLAPILLEIGKSSKVLECGTGIIIYFEPTLTESVDLHFWQRCFEHFFTEKIIGVKCLGSGTMTLFLSQHLGNTGVLHTFDITEFKALKAKEFFFNWKNSFDSTAMTESEKWPSNVKFGVVDFCNHTFDESFSSK